MPSFNQITLMGHLTRDPSLKFLPNNTAVCEFGIACNRKWKTQAGEDREDVLFIDCTVWGKRGEVVNQYFTKGKPIFVQGHLRLETWEDKNGGGKRSKHTVQVDDFQFIGGDRGGDGGGERTETKITPRSVRPTRETVPDDSYGSHLQQDDIPF